MGNSIFKGDVLSSNIPDDVDLLTSQTDTVFTAAATCSKTQVISGTASGYTWRTPDATSMPVGWTRTIRNASSQYILIDNGAAGSLWEWLGRLQELGR
jgi:hypothetical protein